MDLTLDNYTALRLMAYSINANSLEAAEELLRNVPFLSEIMFEEEFTNITPEMRDLINKYRPSLIKGVLDC
jgi:hypothetical protein